MRSNNGEHKNQQILFSKSGEILDSDDTIFPITLLREEPVQDFFPFIESIYDTLLMLTPEGPPLHFECIATGHAFLPGFYDFNFSKKQVDQRPAILWVLTDRTRHYQSKRERQQEEVDKLLNS